MSECFSVDIIIINVVITKFCFGFQGEESQYSNKGMFECLKCAEGCDYCEDERPCVASLNWVMRTALLILSCIIICCLPLVILFTWKYGNIKVSSNKRLLPGQ